MIFPDKKKEQVFYQHILPTSDYYIIFWDIRLQIVIFIFPLVFIQLPRQISGVYTRQTVYYIKWLVLFWAVYFPIACGWAYIEGVEQRTFVFLEAVIVIIAVENFLLLRYCNIYQKHGYCYMIFMFIAMTLPGFIHYLSCEISGKRDNEVSVFSLWDPILPTNLPEIKYFAFVCYPILFVFTIKIHEFIQKFRNR